MRNTQTTAHLPRAYSTSHAQKALNRIRVIRVYVRFRAHVTVFCLGDGECRSAFDGPKPLITRRCQRNSVHGPCDQKINSAPTTDRETVWRRAFWSFFYLHDSNGAQIGSDARNNAKQADDVMQRMPRSDLFFHLLFANSVQMDPDARSPHFHRRQAEIPVITFS